MSKIRAASIKITRVEGPSVLCGRPITVTTWEDARHVLWEMAQSAPKTGGYDKVDFTVLYEDGNEYSGRCDIKHWTCENNDLDLVEHITSFQRWAAGWEPDPWCGIEEYEKYLGWQGTEAMKQAQDFLTNYEVGDSKPEGDQNVA